MTDRRVFAAEQCVQRIVVAGFALLAWQLAQQVEERLLRLYPVLAVDGGPASTRA